MKPPTQDYRVNIAAELLPVAEQFFGAGNYRSAAVVCRKILDHLPGFVPALRIMGAAHHLMGLSSEALKWFREVVEREPEAPSAWSNLGVTHRARGSFTEARRCFEQALALDPCFADAWNNLGTVLEGENRSSAMICYRRALHFDPEHVTACNNLGRCFMGQQMVTEAETWYRRSLELFPQQPETLIRLGEVLEQAADVDGAAEAYGKSLELRQDAVVTLRRATLLPVIIPSGEEITPLRERVLLELERFETGGLRIEKPWERGRIFFYLSYHGLDDRRFHEALARIYRSSSPELTWTAPHVTRARPTGGRVRIGFISRFFFSHTIAKLNIGLIEAIDRNRFHVTVFLVDSGRRDGMTERFSRAADRFITLTGDIPSIRRKIAEKELDILFYTDIGMEPVTYFLAFSRLSRIQCVTWGHPATSGIDTIDYFISHEECETTRSRDSYTEQLFCLSSEAAPACYAWPDLKPSDRSRSEFGLSPSGTLYLCPQPLFKIHPDFDGILARILDQDPTGIIVFLRGVAPRAETLLKGRLEKSLGRNMQRICFLDPLPFQDYLALVALADVVLDTPHFSGGSSTVEALATGAVVVTLPSPYLKGRLTFAWYRRIGVTDCIADSADDYVTKAVRLGSDRDFREEVRSRIRSRIDRLFDDRRMVRELEEFFVRSVDG